MASYRVKNGAFNDTFIHTDRIPHADYEDQCRISSWNTLLETFVRGTKTRDKTAKMIRAVRSKAVKVERIG